MENTKQRRPQTTKAVNPFTQSQTQPSLPPKAATPKSLLYKDYTVREENSKKKEPKKKMLLTHCSDLKTTTGSSNLRRPASIGVQTPQPVSAADFRQNVTVKFNNFLRQVENGMIAEDDSLLQDSQQSRTRSEKGNLVWEQKQKRRQEKALKTQREEEAARKKRQNLQKLDADRRTELKRNLSQRARSKSKEQKEEAKQMQIASDLVEKHRPQKGEGAGQQLTDLRCWIEDQITKEKMREPLETSPDQSTLNTQGKSMTQTINMTVLSQKDVGIVSQKQKTQLLKHQLPGNSLLPEKEEAKLGSRKNRYGVFETGPSEFDQVVEIERQKLEPKVDKTAPAFDSTKQAQAKKNIAQMVERLAARTNGSKSQSLPAARKTPSPDLSEDSLDKIPVRENSMRPRMNLKANEEPIIPKGAKLPGVTDTKQKQADLDAQQRKKESAAALVIQKWLRGHWGRKAFSRQLFLRREEIEMEYGYFEEQYKNQKQYNLKKYLHDKQKIRKQSGLDSIAEDIAEVIGESSSSAPQISMTNSLKVNNFFGVKPGKVTEFDPLSLISIYAKKNGKPPSAGKEGPSSKIRSKAHKPASKQIKHSSSEIVEDIYSEKYSDIQEDIDESIPAASASGSGSRDQKKKDVVKSDSIIDEIQSAAITGSGQHKDSDSAIEDVAESAVDDSIKEDSIMEDSIIRDQFASDNYKVNEAQKRLEAQQRHKYGMDPKSLIDSSAQKVPASVNSQNFYLKTQVERDHQDIRHKNVLHEVMQEMRAFEAANINQNMMDRMEKIVISSLAQKDQIIMAQSLAEMQRELRHKEEINRIREDQIKLMTQLLLLGGFGGTQQPSANITQADKQKQELYNNIQSLIKQGQDQIDVLNSQGPIAQSAQQVKSPLDQSLESVKQVPLSHQQLYQQSQRRSQPYLSEPERPNKFGNSYSQERLSPAKQAESRPMNDEISEESFLKQHESGEIEEDIIEQSVKDSIKESIRESMQQDIAESIGEDIMADSYLSHEAFEEFSRRQLKLAKDDRQTLEQYSSEVERAIDRELQTKQAKMDSRFKQRKLSPRTYQRHRSDLEQWARDQRSSLRDSYRQLALTKPTTKVTQDRIGLSVSDSDDVQRALVQTHLYEQGLVGQNPEQKSIQRKEELANRLEKEKEKAIQAQFEDMKRVFMREQAEQRLKTVLDLDVDEQAKQMFEQYKKQLEESGSQANLNSERSLSTNKVGKNVRFAQDTIPQSVASTKDTREKAYPTQYPQMPQPQPSIEESIDESIQESLRDSYSQSFHSQSVVTDKSHSLKHSDQKPTANHAAPAPSAFKPEADKPLQESQSIGEEIEDQYSEDFASSVQSQSHRLSTSKKLMNKAQQLKESRDQIEESIDDYADDQFEESIGQSYGQSAKLAQSLQDKQKESPTKMESVKEESSEQHSPHEDSRHSPEPEMISLPSVDHTVQESAEDVDWQIQVPESVQQPHAEEEVDEDSMNDRYDDQYDDEELESNPDAIGHSGTHSLSRSDGDIIGKADRIAQELMDLILAEYKGDNQYLVSTEKVVVDEDDFREKFPYTLDRREPEVEIRPPQPMQIQIGNKPEPKKKTEKELADEAFLKKHEEQQKSLKEHQDKCREVLDFMVSKIDLNQMILSLDQPVKQNPLVVLANIQAYDDDEEQPMLEDEEPQKVLTEAFFVAVDKEYQKEQRLSSQKTIDLTESQHEAEKITNVHNYALFEALNEALDNFRPYKNKGGPMPWSSNTRVAKQQTSLKQAKAILESAVKQVLEWGSMGAGSRFAPLPPPPTQTQDDYGEDIVQPPLADGEEERRNQQRQEKLGQLVTQDIHENDPLWTDYETEDTQARFDLADMILSDLAQEIADILSGH